MLNKQMLAKLNEQITKETYSGYLYLQMAAWFESQNLSGFANWMKIQAQEEISHMMIFYNYVNERGGMVEFGAIDKPPEDYSSSLDIFEKTLTHEQKVTASINDLMDLAIAEKDYATKNRLEWFISEQVEEEANASELVNKVKLIGEQGNGIFMLDKELSTRTFTMPSPLLGE